MFEPSVGFQRDGVVGGAADQHCLEEYTMWRSHGSWKSGFPELVPLEADGQNVYRSGKTL